MASVGRADDVLGHRVVRAMAVGRVPGCAVACVSKGEVVWTAGFGIADETVGSPVSPATTFQVASVSKVVTAWAALALVADDKITLDSPIVEYLTRWRFDRSSFDPMGITLRALLTHTAGLPTAASPAYPSPDAVPACWPMSWLVEPTAPRRSPWSSRELGFGTRISATPSSKASSRSFPGNPLPTSLG